MSIRRSRCTTSKTICSFLWILETAVTGGLFCGESVRTRNCHHIYFRGSASLVKVACIDIHDMQHAREYSRRQPLLVLEIPYTAVGCIPFRSCIYSSGSRKSFLCKRRGTYLLSCVAYPHDKEVTCAPTVQLVRTKSKKSRCSS